MTQKDKDLLLQDLSSRLPYGVILNCCNLVGEKLYTIDSNGLVNNDYDLEEVKPCLFPLSSMTENQREELYKIGWYLDEDKIYSCFRNYDDANYKTHIDSFELINWCYKNHFDINGLIPMGLASDATGLNIYN